MEGLGKGGGVMEQHRQCAPDVQEGHGRHQRGGGAGDASYPTYHHQPRRQSRAQPHRKPGQSERGLQRQSDGGGLNQVSTHQSGGQPGQGKKGTQQRGVQAVCQIEHGSALKGIVRSRTLVAHR